MNADQLRALGIGEPTIKETLRCAGKNAGERTPKPYACSATEATDRRSAKILERFSDKPSDRVVLAIDPGPEKSAFVIWDGSTLYASAETTNEDIRRRLRDNITADIIAIEMVACYGMAVGAETFDTCRWIGRFEEVASSQFVSRPPPRLIYRKDVKMHLCHSMRAKDANIRQALIDKHGPVGTKKAPGKLFGISGHLWAALAVADYALTLAEFPRLSERGEAK